MIGTFWLRKYILTVITAVVVFLVGCDSGNPSAGNGTPDPGSETSSYGFLNEDNEFFPGEIAVVYSGTEFPVAINTTVLIDGVEQGSELPVAADGSITFIVPSVANGTHKLSFQVDGDTLEFDFNVSPRPFTVDMESSITTSLESDIDALSAFTHEDEEINYEVENAIFDVRSSIASISTLEPEQKAFVYSYIQSLKALTSLRTKDIPTRAIFTSTPCGIASENLSKAALRAAAAGYAISSSSVFFAANPLVGGLLAGSGFLVLYDAIDSIKKSFPVLVEECVGPVSVDLNVNNHSSEYSGNQYPLLRAVSHFSFTDGVEYIFEADSNYEYDERITQTIDRVNALLTRLSSFIPQSILSFFGAGLPEAEGETNYSDIQISKVSESSIQVNTSDSSNSMSVTFSTTMDEIPENGVPFTFDLVDAGHPELTVNYSATLLPAEQEIDFSGSYRMYTVRDIYRPKNPNSNGARDDSFTPDFNASPRFTMAVKRLANGKLQAFLQEPGTVSSGVLRSPITTLVNRYSYCANNISGSLVAEREVTSTTRIEVDFINSGLMIYYVTTNSALIDGPCYQDRDVTESDYESETHYVIHPDDRR